MLCINSSNSFSRFCSHLNRIIDIQHTPLKKKKKKEKKNTQKTAKFCYCCGTWHHLFLISFLIIIWKENILE